MPIQTLSLKIDFKIDDRQILRIVDLGDGFGAGIRGFEDVKLHSKLLCDTHAATGASIATLFGELPLDAMQPDTINIPLVLRQPAAAGLSYDATDLPTDTTILSYSQKGRLASYVSHLWKKQRNNTLVAPPGLIAAEMHKALWYMLMQKHMPVEKQAKVTFWSNAQSPGQINLDGVDDKYGYFIKIADRSTGGAYEVFYASNKTELLKLAADLHKKYHENDKPFKHNLFVIESAYMTIRQYRDRDYNVTGRAFITIIYDPSINFFDVKIAAAKWMLPTDPLAKKLSSGQMLSNVKNTTGVAMLTPEECEMLTANIRCHYRKTFEAGFENINLLTYLSDNPVFKELKSCLRPDSSYNLILDTFYSSETYSKQFGNMILEKMVVSVTAAYELKDFNTILAIPSETQLFVTNGKVSIEKLMHLICVFSFYDNFIVHLKATHSPLLQYAQIADLVKQSPLVKSKLNRSIVQFIQEKNKDYEIEDFNKTLRQAAFNGDLVVVKLLIYTHKATVNALSPSNKTALDYAQAGKDQNKKNVLELLKHLNAKTGKQLQENVSKSLTRRLG